MDIDVSYDSRMVITLRGIPGKCDLVRMIRHFYQFFAFFVFWTQYRAYERPRQFLDKNDVKSTLCFKNDVNNVVVLVNVLRANSNILQNHAWIYPQLNKLIVFCSHETLDTF